MRNRDKKLVGVEKIFVRSTPAETEKAAMEYLKVVECSSSFGICGIKAFNLDISTGDMWIFTEIDPSIELYPPEISMRPGVRLYMKKPSRVQSSVGENCSSMVFVGGSKDIIGQAGGGSDAGTADDSDYTHETQSLLGKSESNDSSEGGLLNSRQSRSIASSSSGHDKSSSYQQVQLHALHFFDYLNFTSLHFTSLYFTSLYFTLLYFTSLYFTLLYFTLLYFTSLHFTSLPLL